MYTNVIATAFKRVATVEEACEIFDGFHLLAKRPNIRRFLEKKAGEVWKFFSQARHIPFSSSHRAVHLGRNLRMARNLHGIQASGHDP